MASRQNKQNKSTVQRKQVKKDNKKIVKKIIKKDIKKAVKKVIEKKDDIKKSQRNRHFSVIYNGQRLHATPSGKRPKQAANKALTSIFKSMDEATKKKMIGQDIKFCLYENCKRKKNAKGLLCERRIFRYTGKRVEIDSSKGVGIPHEVITYCSKCKDLIEHLRTIEDKNTITKKQVFKNIKLLKKYLKTEDIAKRPELNEHIKKHMKEYEDIVKCDKCKKEIREIPYKFTNTVKKTDDKDLTEEDKKINSEFIDQIENKLKEERKTEEKKQEEKQKPKDKQEKPKEEPKKVKKNNNKK